MGTDEYPSVVKLQQHPPHKWRGFYVYIAPRLRPVLDYLRQRQLPGGIKVQVKGVYSSAFGFVPDLYSQLSSSTDTLACVPQLISDYFL